MIMRKDVFMLQLDTLLEAIVGNLTHIILTFKQALAHVTKQFCLDSHVHTFLPLIKVDQLIFDNLYKIITPHELTFRHRFLYFISYLMSWSGLNTMDQ